MSNIGHNNPPADPFTDVSEQISGLEMEARNWLDGEPVANEAQASEIAKLLDGVRKAKKAAEDARKAEKQPHLDAGKAVDAKYKPLTAKADMIADGCKSALAPFLRAQEAEKRRKEAEARAAAEKAQREAQEALAVSRANDLASREEAERKLAEARAAEAAASRAAKDKAGVSGGGRKVSMRTVLELKLTDAQALGRHLWATDYEALEMAMYEIAQKQMRAGKRDIPGCEVIETKVPV